MSWSFEATGTPQRVLEALEAKSEQISKDQNDHCRKEFDEAKPHLVALVKQNFTSPGSEFRPVGIKVSASGSCSSRDNVKLYSQCSVNIESLYGWVG